jgi:hypothetical protein
MTEIKKKSILPEFQSFLSSRKLAPEKNISFYAYWAWKFLAFCNTQTEPDVSVALAEFLQSLKADQSLADWQIKQAEEAVRLYRAHFKGDINPKSEGDELAGRDEFNTGHLIEETKRLIRLKHYSYSTERTYIDTCNRPYASPQLRDTYFYEGS